MNILKRERLLRRLEYLTGAIDGCVDVLGAEVTPTAADRKAKRRLVSAHAAVAEAVDLLWPARLAQ
jgi:hypothetical protein